MRGSHFFAVFLPKKQTGRRNLQYTSQLSLPTKVLPIMKFGADEESRTTSLLIKVFQCGTRTVSLLYQSKHINANLSSTFFLLA